ncbi:MAG: SDR family oxidoreductase [Rhodospirillaceae bacterium]|nr:SDR family oxidoreductase [Rhodospirillaceae bacterium]
MRFKDQVVWITGASSGIGEGLAYEFAREGAKLVLSARRADQLERVKAACTGAAEILLVPFDMLDDVGRARAVERVLAHFGHVDVMVQNAGVSQRALAKDTSLSVDRKIMELDYFSVVALTKLLLPSMIARKAGHFVVTSSVAGKMGVPLRSAYAAAKHALHGFFDTLMVECAPHNILASLVVVAGVQTEVSLHALKGDGTAHGAMDDMQARGMTVAECARIVVDGTARKKHEINALVPPAGLYVWLRRVWPGLLYARMKRMSVERFTQHVGPGRK